MSSEQRSFRNGAMAIAAVIPNWNQAELTMQCIGSVRDQVAHVYVVDNGSMPADRKQLEANRDANTTVIVSDVNRGYAGGCNIGIRAAIADGFTAILIMNNDAFADPASVGILADQLTADPSLAAVGPAVVQRGTREVLHASCSLNERTGRASWRGRGLTIDMLGTHPMPTGYLSGEAMLMRSRALDAIGEFDERYFCYYEDVDWSVRARAAGWGIAVVPEAIFEHVVSASSSRLTGTYYRARNIMLFLRVARRRGRLASFLLAAPVEMGALAALLKGRRLRLAMSGVMRGWLQGAMMRI